LITPDEVPREAAGTCCAVAPSSTDMLAAPEPIALRGEWAELEEQKEKEE
jgi:hypothetical protein